MDAAKLSSFGAWMRSVGAKWDGVAMRASPDGQRGACVVATRAVAEGTVLLSLPKAAVLSVRTASNSEALEAVLEAGLDADAALNLAVAHERGRGRASRWFGYLDTLPEAEPLPFLWSEAELRLLAGTGLDKAARRRRRELEREYAELRQWRNANRSAGLVLPSLDAYLAAASLTSSRAFHVDAWHGEALVPGADVFNHKAALVPEGCEVEGEEGEVGEMGEEEDEDNEEGEADGEEGEDGEACEGDEGVVGEDDDEEGEDDDEEGEDDDEEDDAVRLADADLREGARLAAGRLGIDLQMDCTLHNLGGGGEEAGGEAEAETGAGPEAAAEEVVAMRAMRALRRGAEVFNTYGEHGDRTLLSQYGFVLGSTNNAMDVAPLPWATLRAAAEAALGTAAARHREQELHAAGCWRQVLGRAFAFDRLGRPPRRLLLAAWLLCSDGALTEAEVERFLALPLGSQLAPRGVRVSPRTVLLEAVRAQARRFDEARSGEEDAEGEVRPQVARDAATLVEGQRAIWRAAEEQLGAAAEQEAPELSRGRGGTKRRREHK